MEAELVCLTRQLQLLGKRDPGGVCEIDADVHAPSLAPGHNVRVHNPLEQLSIEQLRQRTSSKWHYYPADVLPMWVAEMDVPLAEPIALVLQHAVEIGDTGYAAGHAYAHALKDFAAQRWGWDDFPADSAKSVPDVMMGIVEVLRLISEPGDPVVVNCPVYPPFYAFVTHAGRPVVESPLTDEGRIDLDRLEQTFTALTRDNPRVVYLLSSPHNPTRRSTPASWRLLPAWHAGKKCR